LRRRSRVSSGSRNRQFNFSTALDVTPQLEIPANEFGPFAHSMQAKVPRSPVVRHQQIREVFGQSCNRGRHDLRANTTEKPAKKTMAAENAGSDWQQYRDDAVDNNVPRAITVSLNRHESSFRHLPAC